MTNITKLELLSRIIEVTGKEIISEINFDFLPENYKLMHIAKNAECGDYHHHALAIYNQGSKEIIISNYGTHIDFSRPITMAHDLIADAHLSFKTIPTKYSSTEKFIEQIKDLLGDDYKEYKITCTGHSLGGFLSQLAGIKCKSLGFENVNVVAFDSPGAKEIALKLAHKLDYHGNIESGVENYCTRPNIVNRTNCHLGKISYVPRLQQEESNQPSTGLFNSFYKMIGLKDFSSRIDDHMLSHFTNFFNFCEASDPEITLLEIEDWNEELMILKNATDLDRISNSNPQYIQFNRYNNGSNPEYLSCEELEEDYCKINLYDHNDVMNIYIGNYDNDNSMIES
jgi:hypothetical protein